MPGLYSIPPLSLHDALPIFLFNRWIYACFASDALDVRLVRFRVDDGFAALTERVDIVTGMPYTTGRHSGCRPRFGADGHLWRSEEHTSELQSRENLVCRLLL